MLLNIIYMPLNLYGTIAITLFFSGTLLAQQGKVNIRVDQNITQLMDLKKEVNKNQSVIKIQIYSGSRKDAEDTLKKFKIDFPEHNAEMIYETPNYKIWVSDFRTQMQSDRELIKFRKNYKEAFSFKAK
tara:strand:+ start:248 stop:634 length:387 start_codon:yes stop_codon:yes gene_type:complete